MGRNLWNLLVAPTQSSVLLRGVSTRETGHHDNLATPNNHSSNFSKGLRLGHFSHDSAHALPDSSGTDFLRGWKVSKYSMVVDPLKRALIGEMSNAEWEMLEQYEWDDGGEQFHDEAVFIKNRNSTVPAQRGVWPWPSMMPGVS